MRLNQEILKNKARSVVTLVFFLAVILSVIKIIDFNVFQSSNKEVAPAIISEIKFGKVPAVSYEYTVNGVIYKKSNELIDGATYSKLKGGSHAYVQYLKSQNDQARIQGNSFDDRVIYYVIILVTLYLLSLLWRKQILDFAERKKHLK